MGGYGRDRYRDLPDAGGCACGGRGRSDGLGWRGSTYQGRGWPRPRAELHRPELDTARTWRRRAIRAEIERVKREYNEIIELIARRDANGPEGKTLRAGIDNAGSRNRLTRGQRRDPRPTLARGMKVRPGHTVGPFV
jgi:hypothetical protein